MKDATYNLKHAIYLLIVLFYMVNLFFTHAALDVTLFILACIALLIALPRAQRLFFWSAILFLIVGLAISITQNTSAGEMIRSFQAMMGLVTIPVVLLFLQAVLPVNRYESSMKKMIRLRVHNLGGIYQRTSLFTYVLAAILTIATLPISIHSLNKLVPALKGLSKKRFYTQSMLRGYSLALFWSPVELVVIASIDLLNANYFFLLPILVGLSLVYLNLDWFWQKRRYTLSIEQLHLKSVPHLAKGDAKKIGQFLCAMLLFFVAVLVTDHHLNKGLVAAITVVIIPFSIVWAALLGKAHLYLAYVKRHLPRHLESTHNFFALFLAAGFFITMVEQSAVYDWITRLVTAQFHQLPLLLFFLFLGALFWITSFAGFHSLITISLMAQLMAPIAGGIENPLALVFIGSTVALLMISPYNLATTMMATLIRTSPINVFKWNIGYAAGFALLVIFTAYLLTLF